jgi:hypothetical protein
MMFLVRAQGDWQACWPEEVRARIAVVRRTPSIVREADDQTDLFCVGEEAEADRLRDLGLQVILLRDGWYEDDTGGGVAIWGQGVYWEIRDTPLTVKEAVGPATGTGPDGEGGETLDVRRGIFGV